MRITMGVGFSGTSLLINNSVTFDKLGSVNGLAIMLTSAFRFDLHTITTLSETKMIISCVVTDSSLLYLLEVFILRHYQNSINRLDFP